MEDSSDEPNYHELQPAGTLSSPFSVGAINQIGKQICADDTPLASLSSEVHSEREPLYYADDCCTQASHGTMSEYSVETFSTEASMVVTSSVLTCEWEGETQSCKLSCSDYKEFYDHVGKHLAEATITVLEDGSNMFVCDWRACEFTTRVANELLGHVVFHAIHARAKLRGLDTFNEGSIYKPVCNDPASRNEIPILPSDFVCDWLNCGQRFANPQLFYWHVIGHVQYEGKEECKWKGCSYKGTKFCKTQTHMSSHTGERAYACPFCGLFFASRDRIKEHWLRMEQADPEVPRGLACKKCGKGFTAKKLLKEHQRTHNFAAKVFCPHCGPSKVFPYQSRLDRHIVQVHSQRRSFKCQFCPYAAKTESDLKRHVERHEMTVSYQCDTPGCIQSFLTSASLRTHIRKDHGGADTRDRYICHLCQKVFTYVSTLSRHLENVHRLEPAPPSLRFKIEANPDGTRAVVNAVLITESNDNEPESPD